MGIQTIGSQSNGQQQQSHATQPPDLARQNSWYSLTLNEIQNQMGGGLEKPLGSMNLDEVLKSVWSIEANHSMGMGYDDEGTSSSAPSVQRQASMTLAMALSGKTVDQVWKEIQHGQRKRFGGGGQQQQDREPGIGDVTLEDFLIQAGLFAEVSVSPSLDFVMAEAETLQSQTFVPTGGLLSALPSPGGMISDTSMGFGGRKRAAPPDAIEKSIERRLKRKIKNRESAARSRARKQAYCNELESKVSVLQEQNLKLKKEKELEEKFARNMRAGNRYQLRRTSSAPDLSSLGVL